MIIALMKKNATAAQVMALGNLVEIDVASGLRADESATFRLRGIETAIGTGDKVSIAAPADQPVARPPIFTGPSSSGAAKPKRRP
jgi:hypothetical protein